MGKRRLSQIGLLGAAAAALTAVFGSPAASPVRFVDVTRSAGIAFRHQNAASREKYLIETMGSGCAWIDYDRDGLLDLYLVNSAGRSVDRKSTRLNSSHRCISYAVFCLKKKTKSVASSCRTTNRRNVSTRC